jgi:ribonucleoside-diphosphate reductase alpha chain
MERWLAMRMRIREQGLRNSLSVAIAPAVTIASIAGCYEFIEPQIANLFKREITRSIQRRPPIFVGGRWALA